MQVPAIQDQSPPSSAGPAASAGASPAAQPGEAASPVTGETTDSARSASPASGLVAVGLLIGLVMIMGLVIVAMRRRLLAQGNSGDGHAGFMDELRRSLRDGRITQEEYDAARKAMVGRLTGRSTPEKSPEDGRGRSAREGPAG